MPVALLLLLNTLNYYVFRDMAQVPDMDYLSQAQSEESGISDATSLITLAFLKVSTPPIPMKNPIEIYSFAIGAA